MAILATMWPGWATARRDRHDVPVRRRRRERRSRSRCSLAIGVVLTASPVVYQTVERLQFLKVGAVLVFILVALRSRSIGGRVRRHDADRHELRHVPERGRPRDPRRRARRGRRGRREQPRADQLDPRQGLRHGQVRPADRLAGDRRGGGRAVGRALHVPARRGEPGPLEACGGSGRTSSSSSRSRSSAAIAIIVFSLVAYSTVYGQPGPARGERLRLHRARGRGARRHRSARGSARCSSRSARSASSRPRWASSTTSRGSSPTWSGPATCASSKRWTESRLYFARRLDARSCSARSILLLGLRPAARARDDLDRARRLDHVHLLGLLIVTNRRHLPEPVRVRGFRLAALVWAVALLGTTTAIVGVDQIGNLL